MTHPDPTSIEPTTGDKHSSITVTTEQRELIDQLAATFMHAPDYARDAALNMTKLLPHITPTDRTRHLEIAYALLTQDGLQDTPDHLDEHFITGLAITANYLNLDPNHLVAIARRGLAPQLRMN